MGEWGFLDWCAVFAMFIAAVILAIDTGMKQSPTLKPKIVPLASSRFWGFAPLCLLVFSLTFFSAKTCTPKHETAQAALPDIQSKVSSIKPLLPPAPKEVRPDDDGEIKLTDAPPKIPEDLSEVSNDDLRAYAYQIDGQIRDLSLQHARKENSANILDSHSAEIITRTPAQRAEYLLKLDQSYSRVFRQKFEKDALRLQRELNKRLKKDSAQNFPLDTGLIGPGNADNVVGHVADLARELP